MKFLIVETSPLPILISPRPKYSPQDPVFKYFYIYKLIKKIMNIDFAVPVKILKALLRSSILATCSANLNLLNLITLTILGGRY